MPQNFTTPVGRIVQGDPWEPNLTDQDGKPRVYDRGPKMGQPKPQWFIAVAIAKTDPAWPAFHQMLLTEAATAWPSLFPQGANGSCALPTFSFKLIDGDDATPHIDPKTGKSWRYCDKEGFPGHWIVKCSSGFAPKVYEEVPAGSGTFMEVTDKSRLKAGYYVRVAGQTSSNDQPTKPGIYVNLNMIQIVGQGPEITRGVDAATAFGGAGPAALPPGATPLQPAVAGGFTPAPVSPPAIPPSPAVPSAPTVPPHTTYMTPPAMPVTPPAPAPVVPPHTGYMQAPPAPVTPPPPAGPTLTPAGQAAFPGGTYEGFLAAGWTDAALRQAGYVA